MAVDQLVERLGKLDTCAVSDAQDKLGIKGTVIGINPLYPTGRIVGRAVTVRLKSKGPGEEATRHLCTAAVEASDIVMVSGCYAHVERVLQALEVPYSTVEPELLAGKVGNLYGDIRVLNCGLRRR